MLLVSRSSAGRPSVGFLIAWRKTTRVISLLPMTSHSRRTSSRDMPFSASLLPRTALSELNCCIWLLVSFSRSSSSLRSAVRAREVNIGGDDVGVRGGVLLLVPSDLRGPFLPATFGAECSTDLSDLTLAPPPNSSAVAVRFLRKENLDLTSFAFLAKEDDTILVRLLLVPTRSSMGTAGTTTWRRSSFSCLRMAVGSTPIAPSATDLDACCAACFLENDPGIHITANSSKSISPSLLTSNVAMISSTSASLILAPPPGRMRTSLSSSVDNDPLPSMSKTLNAARAALTASSGSALT
mmetsp:Transcript_52988/g.105315  ORF Transcript_52988/g.105315 Transcript_52988/m.105315 type:complete len:297 (+) Transcript_52988:1198-2088(+)